MEVECTGWKDIGVRKRTLVELKKKERNGFPIWTGRNVSVERKVQKWRCTSNSWKVFKIKMLPFGGEPRGVEWEQPRVHQSSCSCTVDSENLVSCSFSTFTTTIVYRPPLSLLDLPPQSPPPTFPTSNPSIDSRAERNPLEASKVPFQECVAEAMAMDPPLKASSFLPYPPPPLTSLFGTVI